MNIKRVAIWGSTGSIGKQTLEIISQNPDKLKAVFLSCRNNKGTLKEQIIKYSPESVGVANESDAIELKKDFPELTVFIGEEGLEEAASVIDCDFMLNALVGIAGLKPTMAAIKFGKTCGHKYAIALANKETLVTGGRLVMDAAKDANVPIIPVDSEHSAIRQCLEGNNEKRVRRIIITASGGPFLGMDYEARTKVTLEDTLAHPNWNMGPKITVDSATMMNKGFEIIEAKWLFDIPGNRIEAIVHPGSIVHSFVEYEDGALIAQLGVPSMKVPISYALSLPDRWPTDAGFVDLAKLGTLKFEEPKDETNRALKLVHSAIAESENKGFDSYAIVINGANEVLVQLFLEKKIRFVDIIDTIEKVFVSHVPQKVCTMEDIFDIDDWARKEALAEIGRRKACL